MLTLLLGFRQFACRTEDITTKQHKEKFTKDPTTEHAENRNGLGLMGSYLQRKRIYSRTCRNRDGLGLIGSIELQKLKKVPPSKE